MIQYSMIVRAGLTSQLHRLDFTVVMLNSHDLYQMENRQCTVASEKED